MEDIGKILKEARERLKKSHEEIYKETKINISQLQALEENNFTFLPETYVKAFLKTYAKNLGLDPDDILNKYLKNQEEKRKAEEESDESSGPVPSSPEPTNNYLEWSLGFGAVILIFSVIFVYAKYRSYDFEGSANLIKEAQIQGAKVEANSANQHPKSVYKETLASPIELEVTAVEKVWLRLTIDNNKVNEYTLNPGNKLMWIAENKFEILVGNAAGIRLNFEGKEFANLGAPGEPMRLVVTKDGLVEQEKVGSVQEHQ